MATLHDAVLFEMLYRFRIVVVLTPLRNVFDIPNERHFSMAWLVNTYAIVLRSIERQVCTVRKRILSHMGINEGLILPGETYNWELTLQIDRRSWIKNSDELNIVICIGERLAAIEKALETIRSFILHGRIHHTTKYFDDDSLTSGSTPELFLVYWRRAFLPYLQKWHQIIDDVLDMETFKANYSPQFLHKHDPHYKHDLHFTRLQFFDYLFCDLYAPFIPKTKHKTTYDDVHDRLKVKLIPPERVKQLFQPRWSIPQDNLDYVIPVEFCP